MRVRKRSLIGAVAVAAVVGGSLVGLVSPAGGAGSTSRASVYVSNVDGASVSVIDPATNEVSKTIDVSGGNTYNEPRNLAPNPAGTFVYVPIRFGSNGTSSDGALGIIDTATDTLAGPFEDASFDEPYALAVTPNNAFVYIANKAGSTVSVFDVAANAVVGTVTDGGGCVDSPEGVVADPVRSRVYVMSKNGDSVCVVDTTTNTVTTSYAVGDEPRSGVVTPNGTFLFVANSLDGTVSKVDLATGTVTSIPSTTGRPRNLAMSSDGARVFVPLQTDVMDMIDVATDAVTPHTFTSVDGCASSLYAATVIPGTNSGYVTDEDEDQVYGFDATTGDEVLTSPAPVCNQEITPQSLPIESPDFDLTRAITSVGDPVVAPLEITPRFTG